MSTSNTLQSSLSSKAVKAALFQAMETIVMPPWVDQICYHHDDSTEMEETYDDFSKPKGLTDVTGDDRDIQGYKSLKVKCRNRRLGTEAIVRVLEQRFDRRSHLDRWVARFKERAEETVPRLIAKLIENGAGSIAYKGAGTTYDDANFFGNGHRGGQNNIVQVAAAGVGNIPSTAEMELAITQARARMLSFTDDGGGLSNANANQFALLVPTQLEGPALAAIKLQRILDGGASRDNLLAVRSDLNITTYRVPFLDTPWGAAGNPKCLLVRTDTVDKPFFRQTMIPMLIESIGEGSEQAKRHWKHSYFIDTVIGEGYGFWETAVQIEFT